MPVKFTNNASATLASGINSTATSISVTSGQGDLFPSISGTEYFYATLADSSNNLEIVKVTARSTDTLTVVRGQDGTTGRTYSAGDRIELRPVAAALESKFDKDGGTVTGNTTFSANLTANGTTTITGGTINSTSVGATTPSSGAFTTLSASSTVSGTGFSTYLASPPAIGGTAAAAGSFTTLSASSTVSGTGFSTYLASPPAIGGTAAAAGTFTTLTGTNLTATGTVTFSGTGYAQLPSGTTAQRPGSPANGMIRYNSTLSQFEGYANSAWGSIGGGATGASTDKVFWENDQTITGNYTISSGKNAGTFGPVTINSGVTVTVPSGSTWTLA